MRGRYHEPWYVKMVILFLSTLFLGLMVVLPLGSVVSYAFSEGVSGYIHALSLPESLNALQLTMSIGLIVLMINIIFGIAIAWAVTKFDFDGKRWLLVVIDLPFTVSPAIAGLIFILLYGIDGMLGSVLMFWDIKIIFTQTGIILATLFVTLPFIARSLIALMSTQGREEEEAAATMGASFWVILRRVTLPNIKWALLYGSVLCFARAIGDFGAVSIVSGALKTLTIEIFDFYNEYRMMEAFALSSILTLSALIVLGVRKGLESKHEGER